MTILRPKEKEERDALLADGFIRCPDCETVKPVEEFSPNAKTWSGYYNYCRPCKRLRDKAYRNSPGAGKSKANRQARAEMLKRNIRQCGTCNQIRPLSDFGRHTASTDGYRYVCKLCGSKQGAEFLERAKASDPMYRRLEDGRKRAKRNGLPYEWFDGHQLREHWLSQGIDPDRCIFTGQKLGDDWELEHLEPLSWPNSKGHVLGNVFPASPKANLEKRDRHLVHYLAERSERERSTEEKASA